MIQVYFLLGLGVFILGLWATIEILRSKKKKAELERDIAETLARKAKRVIAHDNKIQHTIKDQSLKRKERIKKKVEDDIKTHNFDDFY